MDKSLSEKLRNYFSDRIEEIKDGSYVPTYEQIKELPEFSGINRNTFRIARKKWYRTNFRMSFLKHSKLKASSLPEKEYNKKYLKGKLKNGLIVLIIGAIGFVFGFSYGTWVEWSSYDVGVIFSFIGVLWGIILMVIGLILVLKNSIKLLEDETNTKKLRKPP